MAEPIATVGDLAGICGHDGTSWEKILIDASKRLVVAVASVVAQESDIYGYISGAWQKQPLQFGYGDTISEYFYDVDLDAGANTLNGTVVPAGEVWIFQNIAMVCVSATITLMRVNAVVNGVATPLLCVAPPVSGVFYTVQCTATLGVGERLQGYVTGATAGDDFAIYACGYKMDIDL